MCRGWCTNATAHVQRSEDSAWDSVLPFGHRVLENELRLSDVAAVNFTEHATSLGPGAALIDAMASKFRNSYPISKCQVKVGLGVAVTSMDEKAMQGYSAYTQNTS